MQHGVAALEDGAWFLTKRHILLLYDPAVMLLGIYPKEPKTSVHTKTCTRMIPAASSQLPELGSNKDALQHMEQ